LKGRAVKNNSEKPLSPPFEVKDQVFNPNDDDFDIVGDAKLIPTDEPKIVIEPKKEVPQKSITSNVGIDLLLDELAPLLPAAYERQRKPILDKKPGDSNYRDSLGYRKYPQALSLEQFQELFSKTQLYSEHVVCALYEVFHILKTEEYLSNSLAWNLISGVANGITSFFGVSDNYRDVAKFLLWSLDVTVKTDGTEEKSENTTDNAQSRPEEKIEKKPENNLAHSWLPYIVDDNTYVIAQILKKFLAQVINKYITINIAAIISAMRYASKFDKSVTDAQIEAIINAEIYQKYKILNSRGEKYLKNVNDAIKAYVQTESKRVGTLKQSVLKEKSEQEYQEIVHICEVNLQKLNLHLAGITKRNLGPTWLGQEEHNLEMEIETIKFNYQSVKDVCLRQLRKLTKEQQSPSKPTLEDMREELSQLTVNNSKAKTRTNNTVVGVRILFGILIGVVGAVFGGPLGAVLGISTGAALIGAGGTSLVSSFFTRAWKLAKEKFQFLNSPAAKYIGFALTLVVSAGLMATGILAPFGFVIAGLSVAHMMVGAGVMVSLMAVWKGLFSKKHETKNHVSMGSSALDKKQTKDSPDKSWDKEQAEAAEYLERKLDLVAQTQPSKISSSSTSLVHKQGISISRGNISTEDEKQQSLSKNNSQQPAPREVPIIKPDLPAELKLG